MLRMHPCLTIVSPSGRKATPLHKSLSEQVLVRIVLQRHPACFLSHLRLVADPMYHNSGDLSEREGYDFDQLYAITKVQV